MIERILYICAHPDDCELMFGGMISNFVKKNIDIRVIVVSDGTKWVRDKRISYEDIKTQRKQEAISSEKILGLKEVDFLEFLDGTLEKHILFDSLLKSIRKFNPNIIFTHSEEEKHSDHVEVSRTVKRLCNQLSEPAPIINNFWANEFPPVSDFYALYTYATISEINSDLAFFIPLEREDVENKINAILCHKSQFEPEKKNYFYDKIMTESKFFGNLCGKEYAEVCMATRSTHYNLIQIIP